MKPPPYTIGLAVIILLALNLRPVMAALGPVLDLIEHDTRLNSAGAGMLTTLPIFLMGVGAYAGSYLHQKIGERAGIALGISLVAMACAARWGWNDSIGMFLTAASAGLGIAMVQALMPGVIKHWFGADSGRAMGLYTTGIMAGAAFAAASAASLAKMWGWPHALAIWSVPAFLALLIWLSLPADRFSPASSQPSRQPSFFRMPRAWLLAIFFGIGTGAYTLVLAWLPPYFMEHGLSRADSGYLLAALTLVEVIAGLSVSALIGCFPDRRIPLLSILVLILAGIISLLIIPGSHPVVCILLLGSGIGALFPLTLILTLDHADTPSQAAGLAAFVQGGGYIIASTMPLIAGIIRDQFSNLSYAWIIMAGGVIALMLMAIRFSPASCKSI